MWSQKTYEGKKIPFSFIIDASNTSQGLNDFIHFLNSNHSAVFTDGITSGIALDNHGHIVKYFSTSLDAVIPDNAIVPLTPYRFKEFANMCFTDETGAVWVGIIAQANGDLLIFKNRALVFAKRNGRWIFLDSNRIIRQIEHCLLVDDEIKTRFAKELYLSVLDVAFSHTGGCIAIIAEKHTPHIIEQYIFHDYLDNKDERDEKKDILKRLMIAGMDNDNRAFYELDRKLRQDLLGLDGATVIDTTGKIIGSGAIVKIDGGSDEGGRTAAAKQLSCYGFAIKISMDGNIQCFKGSDGDISTVVKVLTML